MTNPPTYKQIMNKELLKLLLISIPILVGGLIFALFVPVNDALSWIDFLFYSIVGFLIIVWQSLSFYYTRSKIKAIVDSSGIDDIQYHENVPDTRTQTPRGSLKQATKIDDHASSYCPSCGKSFNKKYKFCPGCGSCKIKGIL